MVPPKRRLNAEFIDWYLSVFKISGYMTIFQVYDQSSIMTQRERHNC